MEISQATMKDLEGVSNLFNLYRVFYQQTSDLEGARAYIKQCLERKDSVIFGFYVKCGGGIIIPHLFFYELILIQALPLVAIEFSFSFAQIF
ncbi:hypothetical protein [Oceanobacillus sp. FSL K6-3682]|uniref:hypothetical protein n=1 Tax=Oceanobacillus sp. FSL K6-3682 TaxID=2921503 RepID=UPI0030D9CC57